MRNLILYIAILSLCLSFSSCNQGDTESKLEIKYSKAIELNDTNTAITYLHDLLYLDSKNETVYSRLVSHYSDLKNYKSVLKLVDTALTKANTLEKKDLLFLKANALKETKDYTNAITSYKELAEIDKKNDFIYNFEQAILFYENKNVNETIKLLNLVLNNTKSNNFTKNLNTNNGIEKVSFTEASLNFLGFIMLQKGELKASESYYIKLFKLNPNFKLARNNYILLKQKQAEQIK
jgi:tetratricopeptide (TPR) repeat protein